MQKHAHRYRRTDKQATERDGKSDGKSSMQLDPKLIFDDRINEKNLSPSHQKWRSRSGYVII